MQIINFFIKISFLFLLFFFFINFLINFIIYFPFLNFKLKLFISVFIFFGVIATVGSNYVQSGEISTQAIFLSIPIGAFLAERFYKDKKKVIIYLSISAISWCFVLYFIYLFFYDTFRAWLA